MKLSVYVLGEEVAQLESVGDFKSVMAYKSGAHPDSFVSLTMPVRTESYTWDDQAHPIFQMNLPEGYLLKVLQEEFGPQVGASPLSLLSVVGRNMVGRVQVAAQNAVLDGPPQAFEVKELLNGDNSEERFASLVRRHVTSGVSGVVPKFLDGKEEVAPHHKATVLTRRHIIKGSSSALPFVSLNEHLCMQVASRVQPCARTQVSDDGMVLVVDRFDVDEMGRPRLGLEDFCALLGMRAADKYQTTWERIATAVRDYVPGSQRMRSFRELGGLLLLTYALRNSDCHSKNIALLYSTTQDVRLAPIYDMVTTVAYAGYERGPPGLSFMGKRTWLPSKSLQKFLTLVFNISLKEQSLMVEQISDAISEVAPMVSTAIKEVPGFREIGKRMLLAWHEGVSGLRNKHTYAMSAWDGGKAFKEFSPPVARERSSDVIGRSELLRAPKKKR